MLDPLLPLYKPHLFPAGLTCFQLASHSCVETLFSFCVRTPQPSPLSLIEERGGQQGDQIQTIPLNLSSVEMFLHLYLEFQ